MVKVITDSCASIPDKLVSQLDIEVEPYYMHRRLETLRDLVDVKRKEFFEWLSKADYIPQTANPSPGDYLTAFRKVAVKGQRDRDGAYDLQGQRRLSVGLDGERNGS